ncbi:isoprenoid synthase domain-containing protein [Mycena olivaceomarginata]|nr:isoprenoid synthase domain-containing protein [Mycena olivaceomarginata]
MNLILPDIHERWPFTVIHSQWEAAVSAESIAWIESLCILSGSRLKQFRAANFGALGIHCLSAQDARTVAATSMDALRNWETPRAAGGNIPSARCTEGSFSERLHLISSADVLDEFTVNYNKYLTAVIAEAEDRDRQTVRSSLESYLALRRETGAVTCCFNLLAHTVWNPAPYSAGFAHHAFGDTRSGSGLCREYVELLMYMRLQDILSFNVEHARGDTHNAVIVVMHERGLSSQDAMDLWACGTARKSREFCTAMRDLPPCGSVCVRDQVKMYVTGIANWVTGNYEWSLRSGRYFPAGEDPLASSWVVPLLESKSDRTNVQLRTL